jgi:hypothetical protein
MTKTPRQLFKAIDGADGNVVLNFQGSPKNELGVLGAAYHRAGRSLVAQFSSQPGYHDFDGCPIASLYRQALELLIKAVLNLGNHLAILLNNPNLKTEGLLKTGHGLAKHLPKIQAIFDAVGWTDAFSQAGIPDAEVLINEFETVDPGGFAFRYTVKKDGSPSVAPHFAFAPALFAGTLDPVLDALYGACIGLEEYRDSLAEAKAQMASEF